MNLWLKKFRTYQVQYKSDIDHRIRARLEEFLMSPMIVLEVYHTLEKINNLKFSEIFRKNSVREFSKLPRR